MLIRRATPADIPDMHALAQQSDTAAHWALREYDALFAPEAPKRLALVTEEQSCLFGFLIARCDPEEWELENVVVCPELRRGGIGGALVNELLHHAALAKATSVLLEVRESNRPALRLYQRYGFVEVGRRKGYYDHPPEDALLFKREVSFR
jgi:[ribosomal protein S18]-alanine N-acetyltransferase